MTPPQPAASTSLKTRLKYPLDESEFVELFPPDSDQRKNLKRFTGWPTGVTCLRCSSPLVCQGKDPFLADCTKRDCGYAVHLTERSIFHGVKADLFTWISAAWHIAEKGKSGWSIPGLAGRMRINPGLARSVLGQFRRVMGVSCRDRLQGPIMNEIVDLPLKDRRGGKKPRQTIQVLIMLEIPNEDRKGRLRLQMLESGCSEATLSGFRQEVAPGAQLISDGTVGTNGGGVGKRRIVDLKRNLKSWISNLHGDSIQPKNLPSYLDEFCFFYNQKRGTPPGLIFRQLIELAVKTPSTKKSNPPHSGAPAV